MGNCTCKNKKEDPYEHVLGGPVKEKNANQEDNQDP